MSPRAARIITNALTIAFSMLAGYIFGVGHTLYAVQASFKLAVEESGGSFTSGWRVEK